MAQKTSIEWTDVTDNIIVVEGGGWWCRKSSPACDNCYAEKINLTPFYGGNLREYKGDAPPLKLRREIIAGWSRQRVTKKHFVMSMSDVFGPWVPREWQFKMLDGMRAAPRQTFQVLSKWSKVMWECVFAWIGERGLNEVPENIWLGFTAENQEWFDRRWRYMKYLAEVGFTIFTSLEPLLAPVTLPHGFLKLGGRAQAIVGGESGPHARPCDLSNIRSIVEQCKAAGVACFVKQLGAHPIEYSGVLEKDVDLSTFHTFFKDRKGGTMDEWPPDLRVRQFPGEVTV